MGDGKRAEGFGVNIHGFRIEAVVFLEVPEGFQVVRMGVEIEGSVYAGKFCQSNPLEKLLLRHLFTGAVGCCARRDCPL